MKNIVIYFSRKGMNYVSGSIQNLDKGNCEIIAEYIQEITKSDIFEVERNQPYALDYRECTIEAQVEKQNDARPKLKQVLDNIDGYENVFIIGPCWWGTYPMPMFTQLESLNFEGKNVYPIMSHEGSGLGNCVQDLKKYCKGANVHPGLAIQGTYATKAKSEIENWMKGSIK